MDFIIQEQISCTFRPCSWKAASVFYGNGQEPAFVVFFIATALMLLQGLPAVFMKKSVLSRIKMREAALFTLLG